MNRRRPDADPQPVDPAWLAKLHTIGSVEADDAPTEQPSIAADRLQALIARLPDASNVMCSVADLNEVLQELDEMTDLDRSALKTQELRDERNRAVAMWHEQKKRADMAEVERDELATKLASALQTVTALGQTIRAIPDAVANDAANLAHARAERDRLRQEIVDARGETVAEATRADVAEAQRDEARAELQRFANPTPEQVRELEVAADRDEAAYWDAARDWERRKRTERPLTPGLPGYACARCGSLFTSPGEPRDEHSRHGDSPWCRGCADQCHEGGDGHCCAICTQGGAI